MSHYATSCEILKVQNLSPRLRQHWHGFVDAAPELASPYFDLEFTEAMSAVRTDTRVAVFYRDGVPAGFLPFQKSISGVFRPIGGPMGDHHGLISDDPELRFANLLRRKTFGTLIYDGGLATQSDLRENGHPAEASWVVDLSEGQHVYWEGRQKAEAKAMRNLRARERKLDALGGEVVYQIDDPRSEALDQLLSYKRAQYAATGATDVFHGDWARQLVYNLFAHRTDRLAGCLSTMELDGKLVAAHFGIRSRGVLHYWFPAYDPAMSSVAPGLLLFREMIRQLTDLGPTQMHLGPGNYDFKKRFSNSSFDILRGEISSMSVSSAALALGRGVDRLASALPLGPVSNWPAKAWRRLDTLTAVRGI
ncbi:GNAT family N-acetyltransferase [Maricaulis sp. MIT060901]|uniref:GNAT family N-acetyltransferase n=1 Tax=Maricaulis sp. MIT060901 TaxID=3096993 RepID=UPI00399ABB82